MVTYQRPSSSEMGHGISARGKPHQFQRKTPQPKKKDKTKSCGRQHSKLKAQR